jgi:hypothetical protein
VKILKALIAVREEGFHRADVIRVGGKYWIVPTWLEDPVQGYKSPERLVRLDSLRHRKGVPGHPELDFEVYDPVPRAVLFGDPPARGSGFRVVRKSKVRVPIPRGIH